METAYQRSPVAVAVGVASAALGSPDVVGLYDGAVGEIATYGNGQSVGGVRVQTGVPWRVAVSVVVRYGRPLLEIADDVQRRVALRLRDEPHAVWADARVDIRIADIVADAVVEELA